MVPLYNEDVKFIDVDHLPEEIMKYWEGIYKTKIDYYEESVDSGMGRR